MLDLLHTPLTVLHVFVCLMLMLVVLIQPGKSGGLGAALGGAGAQQIFGGRGAGNFLTRTTWIAASVFFVTSVTLAYLSTSTGDSLEDLAKKSAAQQEAVVPNDAPAAPPAEPAPAAPAAAAPAAAGDAPASGDTAAPAEPAPAVPSSETPAPSQP
jgi:preprotein translocase subunit SecG